MFIQPRLLDDHRALEPPDPIPNSEVKRCLADGSVEFLHVRVGHRQAFIAKKAAYGRPFLWALGFEAGIEALSRSNGELLGSDGVSIGRCLEPD